MAFKSCPLAVPYFTNFPSTKISAFNTEVGPKPVPYAEIATEPSECATFSSGLSQVFPLREAYSVVADPIMATAFPTGALVAVSLN